MTRTGRTPPARGPERLVVLNWRDRRHPSAGGAELYCERVARELAGRGHAVTLVTSRPPGTAGQEVTDGYTVRRFGSWVTVYPLALLWLLRRRGAVDAVVDSANGVPFFSPLVTGPHTPVVLLVHHVHQDLFTRALPPLAARLARWLEGPATRAVYRHRTVVVLSPSGRTAVRRRLGLAGPIRVVPGGADTRSVPRRPAANPRVVVVGRLSHAKQLGSLIEAIAQVARSTPTVELHLVGDGPLRADLTDRARTLGAPVVFHGRLSDADRDALLSTAWLTVSASDGGDWSLGLLEANAAGVPALARRVVGVRDTVRHGESGWLVDERGESLATAIDQALTVVSDPDAARRTSQAARAWAERFSWPRTADGVLAAVHSEAARLGRLGRGGRLGHTRAAGERRTANDVSVVLDLPHDLLPTGWEQWTATSRRGDAWTRQATRVRALLPGADEGDARGLLRRLGVDPDHASITVLVARHADLLDHGSWSASTSGDRHVA